MKASELREKALEYDRRANVREVPGANALDLVWEAGYRAALEDVRNEIDKLPDHSQESVRAHVQCQEICTIEDDDESK